MRSAVILLCLFSCAGQPQFSSISPVYVTDRARFALLPPEGIEKPLDCAQQVIGAYGDQEFIMEAYVQADEKGISMAFYNSFGTDMGNFSFSNEGVSFISPAFPDSFKAEYLAADFQFCFYRPQALKQALQKHGLVFEIDKGENGETRRISERGKAIIEIEKSESHVRYTNFLRGYSFALAGAW